MGPNKSLILVMILQSFIAIEVKLETGKQDRVETQSYVVDLIKEPVKQITEGTPQTTLSEVTHNTVTVAKSSQTVQNPSKSLQRTHLSKGWNSVRPSKADVIWGHSSVSNANAGLNLEILSKRFESKSRNRGYIEIFNSTPQLDSKVIRYLENHISNSQINSSHNSIVKDLYKPIQYVSKNPEILTSLPTKLQELHKTLPISSSKVKEKNQFNAYVDPIVRSSHSSTMMPKNSSIENKLQHFTNIYNNVYRRKHLKGVRKNMNLKTAYETKYLNNSTIIKLNQNEFNFDRTNYNLAENSKYGTEGLVNITSVLMGPNYYAPTKWDNPTFFSSRIKRQPFDGTPTAHDYSLQLRKVVLVDQDTKTDDFSDLLPNQQPTQSTNDSQLFWNTTSNSSIGKTYDQKLVQIVFTNNDVITDYMSTPEIPTWEQDISDLGNRLDQLKNNSGQPSLFDTGQTTSDSSAPGTTAHPPVQKYSLKTSSTPNTSPTPKTSPTSDPWPVKLAAETPGDLILGGLMMIHEREDSVTCGPIMPQGGIQALETMLYTLDVINSMPDAPFTLGAHILDDCDKDTYGLEMAVDFIKGSISNIDDAEYHCNKTQVRKVISGVVGAASSVTSIQVANLLRLFKIPQVSFWSTSPELSNKQRFEYFTRTIPSDHYQVKAMVEIVRKLGWSYVSIIYEESNYGIKAFEELEALLAKYEICIAVKEKLVKDSGVAEENAYDNIVHRLLTKPRARGAIIFGSDQEVAGLMRAVRRCNATGNFSWIGSDGWSARSLVWQGNEREVEGTLSVQPQANPVKGFDQYFLNLTADNNRRNPWFIEFWEHHFRCRHPNSSRTPHNLQHGEVCGEGARLTADNTAFENQLQFVSDAVMAFAVALRDMHRALCGGRRGLCEHMRPTKGPELLKYLRKVNFQGLSGDKFKFDSNGDGPARYNIIHFKRTEDDSFRWFKVGEYIEGELTLNMSDIQWRPGQMQPPESVCSLPCELGQAKQYVEGESCCWHCFNCTQYQIRHPLDETQCVMCPEGTSPNPSKEQCLDIPEVFLKAESAWAIGAMCLSSTGIIITLLVASVFVRHNNTPVVKAAGRELSYVLLVGILLCYSVTFVLVLRPSNVVCGVQRFCTGFCFTVVYAALFTKTNRIARIFNAGKRTTKRPKFISPKSQIIICSALVSVQVFINGAWMLVSPPHAIHHYPSREDNLLVCASYVNASYMIAFGYPILLIVVCTVYAVLTRNIPEAFNESKHIGFTMYTTCVIWLAFVPLYFGTGNHMPLRITSMSVTISLSASVTLVCLFSPKLYIILVRPERNVRQSMMPSRHGLLKSGTTASVMVGAAPIAHTHQPFAQVLAQRECIALKIDEDVKKRSKEKTQSATRATQTLAPAALMTANNKTSPLVKVHNSANSVASFTENGPPL